MCGVAGVLHFDGRPVAPEVLLRMAGAIVHRGPDDSGEWTGGPVGLAHRRLSIIDVAASAQPMCAPNDGPVLCFNGEILNYRELRTQLHYPFRTQGDTETLLAACAAWGPEAFARLRGQFAGVVVLPREREIWLFRDRLGILPLYYHRDGSGIRFASEVKALVPALPGPLAVDEASLPEYLARRAVPAPHTLFAGVRKVRPGHVLRVTYDGAVSEARYWSAPEVPPGRPVPPGEAVQLLDRALRDAVTANLVADVPVGAYLSGGVDSSLIAALASQVAGRGLDTISAGFGDPRWDELPYAREVSAALGTRHHEVHVRPGDFADLWEPLTWHRDAPISEPADVAVFRLAQEARRQVKVVLSGEGSDELFAGYPKYRAAPWVSRAGLLPYAVRAAAAAGLDHLLPPSAARLRPVLRATAAASPELRLREWFAPFGAAERLRLLGHDTPRTSENGASGDVVRDMLLADCATWLPDNLLERGDRMSMAASLELRPPFLDHHVVELAFRLPTSLKVRRGQTKWLVKQVAATVLPRHIVQRRKVGFRVPLDAWFRGALATTAADQLLATGSFATEVFDRREVAALLARHRSGRANEEMKIWTLLCLETWHRVFLRTPETASSGHLCEPS